MNFELAVLVVYSAALIGSAHRETPTPSRGAYHQPVSYTPMSDPLDGLTAALASRYSNERELGAGRLPTGKPAARPTDCR